MLNRTESTDAGNGPHCTARNGSYTCNLPAGHTGAHEGRFTALGVRKLARFRDAYSPVRTYPDTRKA